MNQFKRIFIWLSRIRYCRGFGIQSPTDYHFVRYVVNEHFPYYQYDILGKDDDWLTRKLGLLYFRIVNWKQPEWVYSFGDSDNRYADYIHAGCKRAKVIHIAADLDEQHWRDLLHDENLLGVNVFRISLVGPVYPIFIEQVLQTAKEQTLLILEGIHRNKETLEVWRKIVMDHNRSIITFDLYYCGIVFFDKKRIKQHYIVNF